MRILVVDDERLICEWLEFCISKNPNCQLVGVAHNGKEGLDLFKQQEPDLVLTDVKMPVMDGIELLHAIKKVNPQTHVVLLTAFADFEVARNALREGVDEYLLKTEMNNDVLQRMLERLAANRAPQIPVGPDLTSSAQLHAIVCKILKQPEPLKEEELEELRHCGVRWRNNGLFAMAVWKQSLMNGGLRFPENNMAKHVVGVDYSDRIYVVVGNLPRALSAGDKEKQMWGYAVQLQEMNHCMVGISNITDEMSMIPALVREAVMSLSRSFYEGQVKLYKPEHALGELEGRDRRWKGDLSKLRLKLYQQNQEERYETLNQFVRETAALKIGEIDAVSKFCGDIYEFLFAQSHVMGLEAESPERVRRNMTSALTLEEVSAPLLALAQQCAAKQTQSRPRSKAIRLAAKYIQSHYMAPLSLEQVAAEVRLTPEYFSRSFKEETGTSFVNYLTEIRLRHSVQLLETTAMRVQDIAQAAGYNNVSYFSTCFKKKYGMSPYEYRQKSDREV